MDLQHTVNVVVHVLAGPGLTGTAGVSPSESDCQKHDNLKRHLIMHTNLNPQSFEDILLTGRWYGGLPDDLRAALMAASHTVQLEAGQKLFSCGDHNRSLYGVISGGICVGRRNSGARETLLTVVEAPNWLGEIGLFDQQARSHDAYASGPATVVHIPGDKLTRLLEEEPRYWQYFGQLLAGKLRLLLDHAEDLALLSTPQRLAKRLILIAESYDCWRDRSRRLITVSQEQLAMMLCLSRQTTNHILRELDQRGLIRLAYHAIEIRDFDGLRDFVRQGVTVAALPNGDRKLQA
jgi:CRP-like cAMP-binding protein